MIGPRAVDRLARIAVGLVLLVAFFELADARRAVVVAITHNDAPPGPALQLPPAPGAGLEPTAHVRVVLIDGIGAPAPGLMPTWDALCADGLDLVVDVGFPTVSLPVQVALWSGRSQQTSGILFHSTGAPLHRALGADAIPAQVPGSVAVAEAAPYIVQSLGFAEVHPAPGGKKLPAGWAGRWLEEAAAVFASPARLAFAHVLIVDIAGHRHGRSSPNFRAAAAIADVDLARLRAAAPTGTRWFVLADHDHLAGGGHGGEELAVRRVRACIAGPGVPTGRAGPIHITDLSRAIADSVGATLPADASGRPLVAAIDAPLGDDDVLPRLPRTRVAIAIAIVLLAAALTGWSTRARLGRQAWWLPAAIVLLVVREQLPTLSTPMIYPPRGLIMAEAFAPALALLAVALTIGGRGRHWLRAVVGQLALPAAVTLAVAFLAGALPLLAGDAVCPVVPRWSGWIPPLMLMTATAAGVSGLVVLVGAALPARD